MEIRKFISDNEAVSPVIGVILMVAITVILAAVIGTFVLGLGDQVQSTSPQASFAFDFSDTTDGSNAANDEVTVVHDGGDSIKAARLSFTASGAQGNWTSATAGASPGAYEGSIDFKDGEDAWDELRKAGDVNAGSSTKINATTMESSGGTQAASANLNAAELRVVWSSESGDNSATLGKWSGPDA